ncbi:uncharacterized protein LOC144989406 [Oryzias latipes]
MATRGKKAARHPRRGGLRSQPQRKPDRATGAEAEWDTEMTSEEEEEKPNPGLGPSGGTTDLVTMMKTFLESQQQREQGLIQELQNLRVALQPSAPAVTTPSMHSASSPRLVLPTPSAGRSAGTPSTSSSEAETGTDRQRPEPRPRYYMQPKIPPYQEGEDIENYLLRFERMAKTWKWPETEWACRLVPLLSGKALDAYTAMDEDKADSYKDLKEALLTKFDISPETYRQKFRCASAPRGETPLETYHRLKGLYRRWIQPERRTKEQVGESIILEQLLYVLPPEVRTWVKEHEPGDGSEAAKLALQYLNARRGGPSTRSTMATRPINVAQPTTDVRPPVFPTPQLGTEREAAVRHRPGISSSVTAPPGTGKPLICYYCQQAGHKASVCPLKKAKVTGACYVPRNEVEPSANDNVRKRTYKTVTVNGVSVLALIDSGSFTSLISKRLVPIGSLDYGHLTNVVCVHGDNHAYPQTEITVDIDKQPYLLTVGVVDNLPVDLLLGRDIPVLVQLLQGESSGDANQGHHQNSVSCPVITRAQAKTGVLPLPDLDESLCEGGGKGPKKSRRQRRFEKQLGITEHNVQGLNADKMWEIPENLAELQKQDDTLKHLFKKVKNIDDVTSMGMDCFIIENGMLYILNDNHKRLVIPVNCRPIIMHLAHTVPWAGHLGRHKTYMRVSSRFYWPGMYTDIQSYCMTCPICQKTAAPRRLDRACLQPLPVISTPFQRIAMDIVGPLEKSSQGHQYILVVCDYATRYPEAFPLRTITSSAIIHALTELFSRVGIPDEILTDQGTNFCSRLMQQFHRQLGIKSLRTTPYHPETDGLVERFNQTLKRMLRKFVSETGKDWHRWLPFLLFAYREVPQASTGFSPFELLYGRNVQGPLDLLSKAWEGSTSNQKETGVVQFILEMRERLARYQAEAEMNLKEAQRAQKTWYDQQARHRAFRPGQKVLLLLPSSTSKLLSKWQGPYTISQKMGPVTYEIHHPDKRKQYQTYHVNLLKEWKEPHHSPPEPVGLVVKECETEEDTSWHNFTKMTTPELSHLTKTQETQIQQVLQAVPSLFRGKPGRTNLTKHAIRLKDNRPIRQRPYRVPQQFVGRLGEEITNMQELGVIEPSDSEWCSPMILLPKKDGSLRPCIDFRKLNAVSEFDAYPMPRVDELLERIGAAGYITTLDLCKGYWQVPLEPASRPYTAFRTPAGLFQFTVMPFGLHGAPATFQRLMDKVLQGCENFSAAYLDDVVIFSNTWENHLQHLRRVLDAIQQAGLTLNSEKCEWARKEAKYLGYLLGQGEVRPQVDKVKAILDCQRPRTKKEVRSFLGLAGWYRRFVPQFATIAAPLTALTTKAQKNPVPWDDECEKAFRALKQQLCSSPVLRSPNFENKFLVQVDASAVGVGAVLAQGEEGAEQPILYLSRKLLPRETRYSAVEKEGLAIKWALESLRYYLLGRDFDLETDHRALTWIHSMKDHNNRLTRWYLALQPFKFTIRHRPGRTNVVADYLSRLPHSVNLEEEEGDVTERL